jgi:hypothetical protein
LGSCGVLVTVYAYLKLPWKSKWPFYLCEASLKNLWPFLLAQKGPKKGSSALLPLRAASPDQAVLLLLYRAEDLL